MPTKLNNQLNFNTILILVIGALLTLAIKKMDEANTTIIQLNLRMGIVESRVNVVEGAVLSIRTTMPTTAK